MLNPVHLRTLQAVLTCGSFADAAIHLGYTASAVSQQMSALEKATGLTLFERLPRSVHATSSAHYLVAAGTEIVLNLRSLERDAKALAAGEQGGIRLGSFATASTRILPSALAAFTTAHPNVDVGLDEGEPEDLLPELLDGPLDVALVYADSNRHVWPGSVAAVPLLVEERLLILPPGHSAHRQRKAVDLRELRDATWVTSPKAPSLIRLCASVGFEPRMAFCTNDFNTVCAFVQAGLGVAIMPELAFPSNIELRPLRVVPKPAQRHILALYRHSNRNPALPTMIDRLVAAANEFPRVVPDDDAHWPDHITSRR
jgi:DNA-binding transcriptional LysR family regulator